MRSVNFVLFLTVTLFARFSRSEPQQKADSAAAGHEPRVVGQQELFIPSYGNQHLLQQRSSSSIYPNNFRNAYQYSQYKYSNRVPDVLSQRWSASPLLANSVHRNYRYSRPVVSDSADSEFNSDSNNGFPYERPEISNSRPIPNQKYDFNGYRKEKSKSDSKSSDSLKNKAKDFADEEQKLTKAEELTINQEFNDQENNDKRLVANKLSEMLLSPVRRKSQSEPMHTSALQSSDQRSLPVPLARQQTVVAPGGSLSDIYFVAIVAGVSAVAIFGTIGAGICVYKVQQSNKAAADVDYPAYGVVGPASKDNQTNGNMSPSGDRKLAQSAQMYHYHHQKQQMIASEKAVTNRRNSASDVESDEENEEGEYTVYECPGLAPTGEMEVKNPLFHDDITPVSSPSVTGNNTKDK